MRGSGRKIIAALLAMGLITQFGGAALAEEEAPVEMVQQEAAEMEAAEAMPAEVETPPEIDIPENTPVPAETEAPVVTAAPEPVETELPVEEQPTEAPQPGDAAQELDFLPLEIKVELQEAVKAGGKAKIKLEVMNVLGRPMRSLALMLWSEDERYEFVLNEDEEKAQEDDRGQKTVYVNALQPGEKQTIEVEITAKQDIPASAPELKAKAQCDFLCDEKPYTAEGKWTMPFVEPVQTEAPSEGDEGGVTYYSGGGGGGGSGVTIDSVTPYIIIQSYKLNPRIFTGDDFTVDIELLNTSQKLDLEGVIASVETSEGISLTNGTNTLYIGDIAKGATSKQRVSLTALPDCKDQTQKLSLSLRFEYIDHSERKQGSGTETISLSVYQKDRLELQELVTDEMQEGREGALSIPYVNKGRGQLYNVEAVLSLEDAETVQSTIYAGNIESGKNGSLDFIVTPSRDGEFSGAVTITYEDEAQQTRTVEVPVSFSAEAVEEEMPDYMEELYMVEETQESSFPIIPVAAGGAALVLVAILVLVHLRRKAKKEAEGDEDNWLEGDQ